MRNFSNLCIKVPMASKIFRTGLKKVMTILSNRCIKVPMTSKIFRTELKEIMRNFSNLCIKVTDGKQSFQNWTQKNHEKFSNRCIKVLIGSISELDSKNHEKLLKSLQQSSDCRHFQNWTQKSSRETYLLKSFAAANLYWKWDRRLVICSSKNCRIWIEQILHWNRNNQKKILTWMELCKRPSSFWKKQKKKKEKEKNRIGQCSFIAWLGFNLGLTLNQPAVFSWGILVRSQSGDNP